MEQEEVNHSPSPRTQVPQPAAPPPTRRWAPDAYERFGQPADPKPPPMPYTQQYRDQTSYKSHLGHEHLGNQTQHPMTAAEIDLQVSRYRKESTPTHLRGRDRQLVTVFYNSFVDFSKIYRIPFKILDDVRIDKLDDVTQERLHPAELLQTPVLYDCYSSAIYARLEEETVLDSSDKLFKGLLQMYNSKRDGYQLLQDLLAATLLVPAQNVGQLSTPPTVQQGTTPYDFACELKEFFACQEQRGRSYAIREKSMMYLQGMQQETMHTQALTQLIFDLKQIPDDDATRIPIRLAFPNNLTLTLLTTAETMKAHQHATINVTRSTPRQYDQDYAARRPDRDRSRERRPSMETGSKTSTNGSRNSRGQPYRAQNGPPRIPLRNPDVQCAACGTSGHQVTDCRILPRVQGCLEYITARPAEAQENLRIYRKAQHPEARRMARDVIKVLRARIQNGTWEDTDDDEDIVDQLTSEYQDEDDYVAPIFNLRAAPADMMCIPIQTTDCAAMQPVKFPNERDMHLERTPIPLVAKAPQRIIIAHSEMDPRPLTVTRVTSSRMDMRRDLADTGASVSATGMRSILHQFTSNTLYEIMGYDGKVTKAAGQGMAQVYNATTKTTEPIFFVYVPSIDGNIISLEHHARTHPRIHR